MLILEQSERDKLTLLKKAIEDKVEISFWYKGIKFRDPKEKNYTRQNWRFAQPTDLGKSKATDKWMLRAYQIGGTTNSNQKAWKTFLVDEMSSITLMNGDNSSYKPFQAPAGSGFSTAGDKKMKNDRPELKLDLSKKPIDNQNKIEQPPVENPEKEQLAESKGFLNWILNFNYESE
jgi:hypothetical protein